MKLLILGNHTCGNRGDSAILRGLLDAINILNPQAEVDVMSRYPVSSSWLLNRPVMGDPLFLQMKQHNSAAGVVGRVKKVLRRRYQHQVLLSRVTDTAHPEFKSRPNRPHPLFRGLIAAAAEYHAAK